MQLARKLLNDLKTGLTQRRVDARKVRLLIHRGPWHPTGRDAGRDCYFIAATNLSGDEQIDIAAIWFETDRRLFVDRVQRRLPAKLAPGETWETWIESEKLPADVRDEAYELARVRLKTGSILTPVRVNPKPARKQGRAKAAAEGATQ